MSYQIGEVTKFLGITADTLRYYEKEGIVTPCRNPENGYREYSFEDIFLLSDVMFYRSVDMSLEEIRGICSGKNLRETQRLIHEKKEIMKRRLEESRKLLIRMEGWEEMHEEAMRFLGKYDIRPLPRSIRKNTFPRRENVSMEELKESIPINQENAYFVLMSFYGKLSGGGLQHYFSLDSGISRKLHLPCKGAGFTEEEHPRCLFTVIRYEYGKDDGSAFQPICRYAEEQGLKLEGSVYGRQSVTIYDKEGTFEYYRLYAPLAEE